MQIKTLYVFDIDDTLTLTAKLHQTAFILALKKMGVKKIDTNFWDYKHHTDSYIARINYEKDRGENFDESKQQLFDKLLYDEVITHTIQEIKGAKQTIDKIENRVAKDKFLNSSELDLILKEEIIKIICDSENDNFLSLSKEKLFLA